MRNLTIQRTSVIIIFAMLVAMAIRVPADTDMWWQLHTGLYNLENFSVADSDPFSHTVTGAKWVNGSWGAELIMVLFWWLAGDVGLALYTIFFAIAAMALVYQVSAGNVYLRGFVLVLASASAAIFWSARPQMVSFFFAAVVLWMMYSLKRHQRDYLWFLLPMLWFWSQLHAGWMIGYLFLFAFIVGEAFNNVLGSDKQYRISWAKWRKLVMVSVLSVPLLVISPYGLDNMLVPVNTVSIEPLLNFIQEWQSPDFQMRGTYPFIALIMLLFMALWTSRLDFDWSSFFLLIGTLFLALSYARNIAIFSLVAVPVLTYHLDHALTERGFVLRPRRSVPQPIALANLVLLILVIGGVGLYAVGLLLPDNIRETRAQTTPIDAVAYLNENALPREIFNSYNWGGYLIYAAEDYPTFIDGRSDMFLDFINTYAAIYFNRVENMRATLAEYDVNVVLVEHNAPILDALSEYDEWSQVYEDDLAVIWVRSDE